MIGHETIIVSGASGTAYSDGPVMGLLEYIQVTYTNAAATGDVTITDDEATTSLLTLTDNTTNVSAPVRKQAITTANSAITGVYERIPLTSRIKVVVAQENANSTVQVDVWYEREDD